MIAQPRADCEAEILRQDAYSKQKLREQSDFSCKLFIIFQSIFNNYLSKPTNLRCLRFA